MATSGLESVIRHLRRALLGQGETGYTDGELLGRFISRRDEFAFETLMLRHGPMVLGACRRVLGNDADADDAFQATFLVLVRKAATIRPRNQVGNWLYGVARSTALKARAMSIKRSVKERVAAARPLPDRPATGDLLGETLDKELLTLPEKYRAVIVLCDLEGRSLKDAARQLNCPVGTIGTRLARGRTLLAECLRRRGVALPASAVAVTLAQATSSAALPAALVNSTVTAAIAAAMGQAASAGAISANVAALTEGVLKAMLLAKLKIAATTVIAVSAIGFATVWATQLSETVTHWPKQVSAQTTKETALAADNEKKPDENPNAAAKKADEGWSESVGGARIRIRATKTVWRVGETPELMLDVHNEKVGDLAVPRWPYFEVDIDTAWYVTHDFYLPTTIGISRYTGSTSTNKSPIPPVDPKDFFAILRQGEIKDGVTTIRFEYTNGKDIDSRWIRKSALTNKDREVTSISTRDPKNRLSLAPGKHTIRVACDIERLRGDNADRFLLPGGVTRLVSKLIEIEIVEPK